MIPNPTLRVLSSIRRHRLRALLMGGQACVFYGAAEFSRDTDLAVLANPTNLGRLRRAMSDLEADVIAVPPFELKYLRRGHAVHFRCHHRELAGARVDVMSRIRGVAPFAALWRRRTTIVLPDGTRCDLLAISDLVKSKKTQRDKDWPMVRRLVEAHYFQYRLEPDAARVRFWLQELRTPELLVEVAVANPGPSRRLGGRRRVLIPALRGRTAELERMLLDEEMAERRLDRDYWLPLRRELEDLRRARRK